MDIAPPSPPPPDPRDDDPPPAAVAGAGAATATTTEAETAPTGAAPAGAEPQRLHRCRSGRMVAGVAAGLADYLDIDVVIVRIALVVLACTGGLGIPLYLAGWLLIPEEDTGESVAESLLGVAHPS